MRLFLAAAFLAIFFSACQPQEKVFAPLQTPPETATVMKNIFSTEIIVRTAENFHSESDIIAFVDMAVRNHVSIISVLVKQDEDSFVESGQVFYRSNIAPIAPGYMRLDVLQTIIDAAHKHGIKVRAWMPQFHDQVAAKKHPDWQMMALINGKVIPYTGAQSKEYFVNPLNPQVQEYELSLIEEVAKNYAVDGIVLDWIRFDDYNMDLGDATRQIYKPKTGVDPLTIDFSKDSAELQAWNDWRTTGIADYVRTIRQNLPKDFLLGVYILPPEFVEVGQDAGKFNMQVDFIAPMCYFRDWGYPLEWVWKSCLASTKVKAASTSIMPTMDSNLSDDEYQQILSHIRSELPQVDTLSWFYHEQWTEDMLKRIDLIRSR
jgi:hypothetical protein